MSSNLMKPMSPIRRAWLRWKALRLPWRKRFLVGLDLSGATFWEFRDTLSPGRMRRIVQYPRSHNLHYSDVSSQISPAWHQWLRHTRRDPPSLTEQAQNVQRQEQLKVLAAQADARWASKPSYLDAPGRQRGLPVSAIRARDSSGYAQESWPNNQAMGEERPAIAGGEGSLEGSPAELLRVATQSSNIKRHPITGREQRAPEPAPATEARRDKEKNDPWKKHARGGPSEEWQPQAWDPNALASPARR